MRIQNKYREVKHDLEIREDIIIGSTKECTESFNQLQNFVKLYDVIKTERNRYVPKTLISFET